MKKAKATIDFEVWNLDCPNCGADHKFDRKEVESEFLYCSECGEAFEPEMTGQEAELLEAGIKALDLLKLEGYALDCSTISNLQQAIHKAEGKN